MKPHDVYLFVFDGLADREIGYAVAGINNPQFQLNPGRYRVRTVSLQGASVLTVGGIRIEPDLALGNVSPKDSAMLILPGGAAWEAGQNMEAVALARTFLIAGVPVAAICGATGGLARGGLLDRHRHTSNALEYLAATGYRISRNVTLRRVTRGNGWRFDHRTGYGSARIRRAHLPASESLRSCGAGRVVRSVQDRQAGVLRRPHADRRGMKTEAIVFALDGRNRWQNGLKQ